MPSSRSTGVDGWGTSHRPGRHRSRTPVKSSTGRPGLFSARHCPGPTDGRTPVAPRVEARSGPTPTGAVPPLDPGHRALILLGGALAGRRIHKSYFALCALPSEPRVGRALPVLDTCLPRPSYGALLRTGVFSPADLGQPPRSDPGRDRDHGTARSRPDRGHAVALSRSRGSTLSRVKCKTTLRVLRTLFGYFSKRVPVSS